MDVWWSNGMVRTLRRRIQLLYVCSYCRVPCSHVGHLYRGPRRRSMHPRGGNAHQSDINHLRVAEV